LRIEKKGEKEKGGECIVASPKTKPALSTVRSIAFKRARNWKAKRKEKERRGEGGGKEGRLSSEILLTRDTSLLQPFRAWNWKHGKRGKKEERGEGGRGQEALSLFPMTLEAIVLAPICSLLARGKKKRRKEGERGERKRKGAAILMTQANESLSFTDGRSYPRA